MTGERDSGALMGWKLDRAGPRIVLRVQTLHPDASGKKRLYERAALLDHNLAVALANDLYRFTGQTRPKPRSWLRRIFGT